MITLTLKEQLTMPLEAEVVTPDRFQDKTLDEISRMPVFYGNQEGRLGEFFSIKGEANDEVVVEGDLAAVKYLGAGMRQGCLTLQGGAGMHLGAKMRGGEIIVHGDAGDWVGAEMRGGKIHVHGNAGHCVGAGYRGSPRGMNRGLIIVDGSAGNEVGAFMRRGIIAVLGDVGDFAGTFIIAGTVLVFGRTGARPGAGMKRGTFIAFREPELLPTFRYDCIYRPAYIPLLLQYLHKNGVPVGDEWLEGAYRRYSGDLTALGKGEILVYDQH